MRLEWRQVALRASLVGTRTNNLEILRFTASLASIRLVVTPGSPVLVLLDPRLYAY